MTGGFNINGIGRIYIRVVFGEGICKRVIIVAFAGDHKMFVHTVRGIGVSLQPIRLSAAEIVNQKSFLVRLDGHHIVIGIAKHEMPGIRRVAINNASAGAAFISWADPMTGAFRTKGFAIPVPGTVGWRAQSETSPAQAGGICPFPATAALCRARCGICRGRTAARIFRGRCPFMIEINNF